MKIELMTMWYNEEFLAPFFLRHYRFVDKIHIFLDADTNDGTRNKIDEARALHKSIHVYEFRFPDKMDDNIKIDQFNAFYKTIAADYVFLVDSDEFIFYQPGYLDANQDVVHFTKLWNVYRHHTEQDLNPELPIREQRRHGVSDFEGWDVYTKPNIVKAKQDFRWALGHHAGHLNGQLVDWLAPREHFPPGVSRMAPLAGAHWSMADPAFVVERRMKGRKDRQSQVNLKQGLAVQHHGITEEAIRASLKQHENDPQVLFDACDYRRSRMESPATASDYYEALAMLHEALKPRTYLEIGVATGESLVLAQPDTLCIGVDPDPTPDGHRARQLPNAVIFEETSDTFFATRDLDALLHVDPLDLAFIDGMHLFEYALRDLINIEANSHAGTVVAVHDCFPLDAVTSSRQRTTDTWTGDVWKLVACLHKYRPDLDVTLADASPSGLCIITRLDRHSSVLPGLYERLLDEYVPLGWDFFETEMAGTFSGLTVSVDEAIDRVSRMRGGGSRTLAKLRRLAAAVAATEARLSEAQAENEEVHAELAAVRAEAEQLHAELAAHAAQLSDIYASTSWRLSAPVRLAGRQAGRLSRSVRSGRVRRGGGETR